MNRFTWRDQYDIEQDELAGKQAQTVNDEPSLTQQHFTEDADINTIMRRFGVTDGAIPPAAADPRYFGDFSDVPDFRTALDLVRDATEKFNALPADIRNMFQNKPVILNAWINDPANWEQAVELGLLSKTAPAPSPEPPATGTAQ